MSEVNWPREEIGTLIERGLILEQIDGNHGELYPKAEEFISEGVPYLSATCIVNGRVDLSKAKFLSPQRAATLKKGRAKRGDVLFAHNATVGPVAILDTIDEAILSTTLTLYRCDEKQLARQYLLHFMGSSLFRQQYERVMGQSTRNQVPITTQREFWISLPKIDEQNKVAEILSTWDRAILNLDRQISENEKMFNYLLNSLSKMKNQRFGKWRTTKLGDLGTFSKGKGIAKSEIISTGHPCIRYAEIYTQHHYVIRNFYSFINEESTKSSKRIFKNDLLFAGSGETLEEIGKSVAFLGDETAYAGGDTIIFSSAEMDAAYLSLLLNSNYGRRQFHTRGQGHSVVHVYPSDLETIEVICPSLDQQKQISASFLAIDEVIERLKVIKGRVAIQKQGLMQKLLTGQVRVTV